MFPCKIMLLILVEVSDFACFNGDTRRKMNLNHLHYCKKIDGMCTQCRRAMLGCR
jgi:hypothetical protein